jgi:MFS family permease
MEPSAATVDRDSEPEKARRRSRRAADEDAVLSAAMTGLTDPFMIPYVLALGASPAQAGLLSSARNLLLALVQLGSGRAIGLAGSRRRLVLWTAAVQALLWIPIGLAAPLFGSGAVLAVIVLYTIATAVAALGGPAWGSLVADYTDPEERGRYFGRRARMAGLAATAASFLAGGVLQIASGRPLLGFAAICAGALVARSLSWRALRRFRDVGWRDEPHLRFGFLAFLRGAPRSNFTRFTLAFGALSLASHVAAPFFAVYLLDGLGYSYLTYTVVVLAGSLTGMLSSAWWGRLGDRYGNHRLIRITSAGVVFLPLLWIVLPAAPWMLAVNALGAFLWGGLNLAATNFLYDAVTPARRHTCIAYFNVVNGLGVSAGAAAGAWLVGEGPAGGAPLAPFFTAFVASAALRGLGWIGLARFVREVRTVPQASLREVVLDLVGQRLVLVLGFLSVRPEREEGRRKPRRERR